MDPQNTCRHPHCEDETGYNYMTNTGQEEKDRDYVGIALAVGIMAFITICQYCGLL